MVVFPAGIVSELLDFDAPGLFAAGARVDPAPPCLVLSGNRTLRQRLWLITESRGCVCRAPGTVAAAWRELASRPRLVFVDIASPLDGRTDDTRAIAETLAHRPGAMLVVCGSPAAEAARILGPDDERWARQLGAFVYLPGVGTDSGVSLIVDEARRVWSRKR